MWGKDYRGYGLEALGSICDPRSNPNQKQNQSLSYRNENGEEEMDRRAFSGAELAEQE